MKKRENNFKKRLMSLMGTRWHAQSHEDSLSVGIPDLSYGIQGVNGWIELKQIDDFPEDESKVIRPKKYTPEQVNWLRNRGRKAGHCFIFVKIGKNSYYLLDWEFARLVREGMTISEYRTYSDDYWEKSKIVPDQLVRVLTKTLSETPE